MHSLDAECRQRTSRQSRPTSQTRDDLETSSSELHRSYRVEPANEFLAFSIDDCILDWQQHQHGIASARLVLIAGINLIAINWQVESAVAVTFGIIAGNMAPTALVGQNWKLKVTPTDWSRQRERIDYRY